jgi:hypothetical protein
MILLSSLYAFRPRPFPSAARGFYEAFVKCFGSAGERLVRSFLSEDGNSGSNQQYRRRQSDRMQDIRVSDEVDGSANNKCAAFRRPEGPQGRSKIPHTARFAPPALTQQEPASAAGEQALPGNSAPQ